MPDPSPSLLTRAYYVAKPYLPRAMRWAMRRHRAVAIRRRHAAVWPINEGLGHTPTGWPGWPDGKQAAVVLTHDVEGPEGLEKVRPLAELEMRCGFRSSFNFIPEGSYRVPESIRKWLTDNGFEVGVHDLNHDGKLYLSRPGFESKARRINGYLRDWEATGFRSGFMLRELDWLHDLDIAYDCSTFDTDPFEPQPHGAHTIFPYWISQSGASPESGYAELPYTLPQDSTLFLLLREADPDIWNRKSDWIIRNGGMVLVNVHPDYMDFDGGTAAMNYPASHYESFLRNLSGGHGAAVWKALPREIAAFVSSHRSLQPDGNLWPWRPEPENSAEFKIWIDLENTPHIPFFRPIVRELRRRGHQVVLTARDGYQTCEMADFHGLAFQRIGRHYGKRIAAKIWGLGVRGWQLASFAHQEKPDLALNLGSRSQNLAAKLLGIPVMEIMDYEHTAEPALLESRWYFMPNAVHASVHRSAATDRFRVYRGLKEDVYVPDFIPDDSVLDALDLRNASVVVTVRPSATEAHYHDSRSEAIFERLMEMALQKPGLKVVLLPRNARQESALRTAHPEWFSSGSVTIPERVVDGLNLIWHSDLVVSGGGTMNREAAALGVPVYSMFRGRLGAVDAELSREGRLVLLESPEDVDSKVRLEPRSRSEFAHSEKFALSDILGHIDGIIGSLRPVAATPLPALAGSTPS